MTVLIETIAHEFAANYLFNARGLFPFFAADQRIKEGNEEYTKNDVDIIPPVSLTKIIAVGTNHKSAIPERDIDILEHPRLFFKPPHTIIGHNDTIVLPRGKTEVVHEAELGVVIGKQCRNAPTENASEYIRGFTCVNDISNLDDRSIDPGGVRVKGFDTAAPVGPLLVSEDEVPNNAMIRLYLNGDLKQEGEVYDMIFSIEEVIAEISKYLTLERGDIIAMGTPKGLGPLSDGDEVVVEITGIGELKNNVIQKD